MMLGTECVKEFNHLTIDASSSESLKKGLETVLGTKDGFEFRELTGGTTNRVVHCKYSGGSCVIRIFGHGSELLVDRAEERHALQVLGQEGVSPKLLATFANGIICEFVPGQVL